MCLISQIAFVASIEQSLLIIMKRPGTGKFKCHMFVLKNVGESQSVARHIGKVTHAVFSKVYYAVV